LPIPTGKRKCRDPRGSSDAVTNRHAIRFVTSGPPESVLDFDSGAQRLDKANAPQIVVHQFVTGERVRGLISVKVAGEPKARGEFTPVRLAGLVATTSQGGAPRRLVTSASSRQSGPRRDRALRRDARRAGGRLADSAPRNVRRRRVLQWPAVPELATPTGVASRAISLVEVTESEFDGGAGDAVAGSPSRFG
jgi:hypothetical protein